MESENSKLSKAQLESPKGFKKSLSIEVSSKMADKNRNGKVSSKTRNWK